MTDRDPRLARTLTLARQFRCSRAEAAAVLRDAAAELEREADAPPVHTSALTRRADEDEDDEE